MFFITNSFVAALCRNVLRAGSLISVMLLAAPALAAVTTTLTPTADAYVRDGTSAGSNFGTATSLRSQFSSTAGNNYDSYLKFDTTSASGMVTSAKLRLYAALSASGSVASTAYGVSTTSWGETSITWNNKPARGNALNSATVTSTAYAWKEIDVTAYVVSEKTAGRNLISLALHSLASTTPYITANSREGTTKPQLVVITNSAPTVSISSPATGATFTAPVNVTINSTATDSDGSISKVEFYNGATLLGQATASPFNFTWLNTPAGTYSLTAKAFDNLGATKTSSAVSITVYPVGTVFTTLTPTADAYVRDGTSAAANFGTATTLRMGRSATAGNNYDSYLKFDASTAPGTVTAAKLRLYAGLSASGTVTTSVYGVSNTTWSETTTTWNNKPVLGAVQNSVSVTSTTYGWKEIDLTSYLAAEKSAGRNVVTLGLRTTANTTPYIIANSRENASNKPQLVLTTLSNIAPTVSLTSPAHNATFPEPGSVTLSSYAADSDGSINRVEFYWGTTLISQVTAAPYTVNWSGLSPGTYTLTARAIDNAGAATTSSAATITVTPSVPPTVSIASPTNGASFVAGSTIGISVNAADSDGTVTRVEVYRDATLLMLHLTPPYSSTYTDFPIGTYSLTAKAFDNTGKTTVSAPVTISVVPNQGPTVSLTSPTNGQTFIDPATITLTASAVDNDGTIARVEFYWGAVLLGQATAAPFSVTWNNVAAGNYSFTAKAFDNSNASATSGAVSVTVNEQAVAPGVYYIESDHLNSPRVIKDQNHNVVWKWDSDPFGEAAANEDPDGDRIRFDYALRFPGQYYDKETGLNYNYFRSYDPQTGRYVQSDPIGLEGGINTYAYVGNNPVNFIDPLGLETVVVINNNTPIIGTHAGVVIGSGSGAMLYDPGGNYRNNEKGSGDALGGTDVNLSDYINHQKGDGPDVDVYRFPTTPAEEMELKDRIEKRGGGSPGSCAIDTSNALKGIGPFKNLGTSFTPAGLGGSLRGIGAGR